MIIMKKSSADGLDKPITICRPLSSWVLSSSEGQPQTTPKVTRVLLTPHLSSKQRCLVPSSPEAHVCLISHLSPHPSFSETSQAWGSWGVKGLPTLGPTTNISLPLTKHPVSSQPLAHLVSLLRGHLLHERSKKTGRENSQQTPRGSVPRGGHSQSQWLTQTFWFSFYFSFLTPVWAHLPVAPSSGLAVWLCEVSVFCGRP